MDADYWYRNLREPFQFHDRVVEQLAAGEHLVELSPQRLAESAKMEMSEARLNQDQARDALTKARVTIHSFRVDLVNQDIQAGMKVHCQQGGRRRRDG